MSNITDTGVSVVLAKPRHIAKNACQHIAACMEMRKHDCTPYDHRTANKKLFVIFKKLVDSRKIESDYILFYRNFYFIVFNDIT